jgi:hypothetical protein
VPSGAAARTRQNGTTLAVTGRTECGLLRASEIFEAALLCGWHACTDL